MSTTPLSIVSIAATAAALLALSPVTAHAADTVHATVVSAFGTVIDDEAEVGPGVEFAGSSVVHEYLLDLAPDGFRLQVSKPLSAGNFTGILDSLVIDGIDREVLSVSFDAAGSSAFSSGNPNDIDLSVPGRIAIGFGGLASANTPATALSHAFRWEVTLGEVLPPVPEPSTWVLMALGTAGMAWRLRRAGPTA